MTEETKPLTLRHERFVAEYLKDSNATRAYVCAGYSPRGAQPSASRLLRRPDIAAAITAGRARLTQALEVSVERLAQEYAKIAFASVDDFITVGDDGEVRVDLEKASQAQRAGIVELKVSTHSKQGQRVTLKLGKLQALAALTNHVELLVERPPPRLTRDERQRYEEKCARYESALDDCVQEQWRLEQELHEMRLAQAEAARPLDSPPPEEPERPIAPGGKPRHVPPRMPTGPGADHVSAFHPDAKLIGSCGRDQKPAPGSADALRMLRSGGFPIR